MATLKDTDGVTAETLAEKQVEWMNEEEGKLATEDGYNCPKCKNKGYYVVLSNECPTAIRCECMVKRRAIKQIRASGLGEYLKNYTFENWKRLDDLASETGERAWENKNTNRWFYIGGQSGAGKTHICTAICIEELRGGKQVVYKTWLETVRALKNAKTDERLYCKLMGELVGSQVLYLDDLFKGTNTTDSDIATTFEIIDGRYRANRKTIISSERTIQDLYNIDAAIANRIIQKACGDIITIDKGRNADRRASGEAEDLEAERQKEWQEKQIKQMKMEA